jgi:hypothetical protein
VLVAGIDFSSVAIDVAIIALDPESDANPLQIRSLPIPQRSDPTQRCITAAKATASLLSDVEGHPVSSVFIEEPWTRSWNAARALFPIYGAILASAGSPTRRSATGITATDWRTTLGMPARASKNEAIQRARDWILTNAHAEQAFNLSEHAAEALLIALAGRHLTWQHHAGTAA